MAATPVDFVSEVDEFKSYTQEFLLNPTQWQRFSTSFRLAWEWVKFTASNKVSVPTSRGVYVFTVEPELSRFPHHGYVMYVGIAGHGSKHTLRARYGDYLYDQKTNRRPRIHYFLNKWEDHVYFYYAVVRDRAHDLAALETAILDAVLPPYNFDDFSVEISRRMRALR